ncbi:MAG: histidinol-phosphatase [Treponema sp.]|nr:histidinol-phosphatase [Treponema sp.]
MEKQFISNNYIKTNYHTHSIFCDGKDSFEDIIETAINRDIKILGFSSHSVYPHTLESNMNPQDFETYCKNIEFLKLKYADKINILCGFEADFIPNFCRPDFFAYRKFTPDFLIGSIHFLYNGEADITKILAIDHTPQILLDGLKNLYHDNVKELIGHYFSTQRQMLEECNFSIIGHPDLIRKFNDKIHFFDESETWYKNELKTTAKAIKKADVIAEINTGAISRGYLKSPYPSEYFLTLLKQENVPIMINSDAHSAEYIDSNFDKALQLAKKVGYTELAIPEKQNKKFIKI